jgi:hypothetical protein
MEQVVAPVMPLQDKADKLPPRTAVGFAVKDPIIGEEPGVGGVGELEGGAAGVTCTNVTDTVWATTTWFEPGFAVAEIVFVSPVVEANVPVATPCALVVDAGCTIVLLLPVALKLTVCRAMGSPLGSLTVTVIVTVALPFAVTVLALAVNSDLVVLGASGETVPPLGPMDDGDGAVVGLVGALRLPHETAINPTTNASVRRWLRVPFMWVEK